MDPDGAPDVRALVAQLTLDEKASLTAGADMWSTPAIERLGIPGFAVTDGPSGARGPTLPGQGATPSLSIPCGSALGATWDPPLVERLGHAVGRDARAKGCRALLAPTVNLHRSPLAGRNFECYSEDPLLTGRLAVAFVRGAQSAGVVTTVKHYAGNEAEFERHSINTVVDERTLRELYLVPFEMAVRGGRALGVMTAYNRLNGPFCSEQRELITDVLRGEWGFEGFVLTDWFAAGSTVGSAEAGCDLEMPGPGRFFGPALAAAVRAGEVDERVLDERVTHLLAAFAAVGGLTPDEEPIGGDERPEDRVLAREAAAASFVLLHNDGVLPLVSVPRSLAVIGPNAFRTQLTGGGSASLLPHRRTALLDALRDRLGGHAEITAARGCDIDRGAPPVDARWLLTAAGEPGLDVEVSEGVEPGGTVVRRSRAVDTRFLFLGEPAPGVGVDFSLRATATLVPPETGTYTFSIVEAGRARLLVDGNVVVDGTTGTIPRGHEFFGLGSIELTAAIDLVAGESVAIALEYSSRDSGGLGAVKVGCRPPGSEAELLAEAARVAAAADLVVVAVGTNDDWESEGHDRDTLALPGAQDEMLELVIAANPNTVVVVNAGAPVLLDATEGARAVLQAWFGGQEMADALVDVLLGDTEPSGRLPTTIPRRLEENPSFGNFPGEDGEVRYGEGLLMGYRWYDTRGIAPRHPFGHGSSYTTFAIGAPELSATSFTPGEQLEVEITVTNDGDRRGAEVVQCYVGADAAARFRPKQELRAFEKVWLDPGETRTVRLVLGDRSFATWLPAAHAWQVEPGSYTVMIGRSSADITHRATVMVTAEPSA